MQILFILMRLIKSGLYDKIWQAYAALLLPIKTVGVMGDSRTYEICVFKSCNIRRWDDSRLF